MKNYYLVTACEKEKYNRLNNVLQATTTPVYLNHDATVVKYWGKLTDVFPDFQFILVDRKTDEPVGCGHSIPIAFKGNFSSLPHGGLDWGLESGFLDHNAGLQPNVQSALFITISQSHLGSGISYKMLEAMKSIGHEHELTALIAPVRPSLKCNFPLITMAEYCKWENANNYPYDPWIRVHVRAGGKILHPCNEAMVVRGTIDQWSEWTMLEFPGDGQYIVPGALEPIKIDHRLNVGLYVEPGIWILHQ